MANEGQDIPTFHITDFTDEQLAMLALFGGEQAIIGTLGSPAYFFQHGDMKPQVPQIAPQHVRTYRCPVVMFNGARRMIGPFGEVHNVDDDRELDA